MPRTARVTLKNAYYHIITRGNQRQPVFTDHRDYRKYLFLLAKYKKQFQFKLYCFCLMPNHVHLIIEVKEPETLNKIMRSLNLSYTLYFNFKHNKIGHLWQDRYKSRIIEKDTYLLHCINYVEANPVRASLVEDLTDYPWNSYIFRINLNPLLDNLGDSSQSQ
jgi:putative transposase